MNKCKIIISHLLCNLNSYLIIILSFSYSLYKTWNSQNGVMKNIFISFWNFAPSFLEVCCLANIEIGYIFRMKRRILKNKILTLMKNLIYLLSTDENEENRCFQDDRRFLDIFMGILLRLENQIQGIRQRARNARNSVAPRQTQRFNVIRINNRRHHPPTSRRLRRRRNNRR